MWTWLLQWDDASLVDRKLFFNIFALPVQGALKTVPANQGVIDMHIRGLGDTCLNAKAVNGERSISDVPVMRYELSQEIRFLDGETPRPTLTLTNAFSQTQTQRRFHYRRFILSFMSIQHATLFGNVCLPGLPPSRDLRSSDPK